MYITNVCIHTKYVMHFYAIQFCYHPPMSGNPGKTNKSTWPCSITVRRHLFWNQPSNKCNQTYSYSTLFPHIYIYKYIHAYTYIYIRTDRLSAKRSVRFYDGLWVVAWWNPWVFPLFLVSILHFGVGFTIQTEDFCGFASAKRSIGSNINGWKWVNFWMVFRFATAKHKRSRTFSSRQLSQRLRRQG